MAKHKGKSKRRIKNWYQRFLKGEETDDSVSRRGSLSRRGVKIPSHRLSADALKQVENIEGLPTAEGMVVSLFPGGAIVRHERGDMLCGLAGIFRPPAGSTALAVGDEVTVAMARDEHASESTEDDMDRADGMIVARSPRRTALSRPRPGSGKEMDLYSNEIFEKVIAANMDILLAVVATAQPPLRSGLIDRFLIIAERGNLEAVLVINKIDLAATDEELLAGLADLGIKIFRCSALRDDGVVALREYLTAKRSILAGASGVGKSTLVNALIPGADAATRSVRMKDKRGRHTTAAAGIYTQPAGGILVDTPGLRELGINMEASELPWYFPEFEKPASQCRFNDCTHTHEPNCAVIAAVEAGEIQKRRYDSYLRILETLPQKN